MALTGQITPEHPSMAGSLARVASEISYECRRCGERRHGLPMSYGADAPAYWDPSLAGDESSMLEQEQCIIKAEHFFVRGRLLIPVTDAAPGTEFDWGVWVSLSRGNFARALSLRTTTGREQEQPYFGWLSTELPLYQPSTLSLKTHVRTQPVGQRPLIELEPTDHPLAVEQRTGITLARVPEIAETLPHALPAPRFRRGVPARRPAHAEAGDLHADAHSTARRERDSARSRRSGRCPARQRQSGHVAGSVWTWPRAGLVVRQGGAVRPGRRPAGLPSTRPVSAARAAGGP
jgi:hypothetical protein